VNAAVVGLLAAALYDPVWTSGITGWVDLVLAGGAFGALVWLRVAPHLVVLGCAMVGWALLG
jgi:chromate transporter